MKNDFDIFSDDDIKLKLFQKQINSEDLYKIQKFFDTLKFKTQRNLLEVQYRQRNFSSAPKMFFCEA